jgi:membrane protein DedA with SNARE-associated domain
LGALAALENIIPPVPADTVVALGAFLAGRGAPISPVGVFLVTWISNVASAAAVFLAARRYGRPFFATRLGRRLISERAMKRIEQLYERWHALGIFISRFLPGYRAVVPPFAGIAGLRFRRALIPMALASGIYYGTLVFTVHAVGENWDEVQHLVGRAGIVLLVAAVAATALAVWLLRRHRARN